MLHADARRVPPVDDYGALEPAISGQIMELHHSKHHQTYVNGFNTAMETLSEAQAKGDAKAAAAQAPMINFHGGGHVNHSLFWENLAPNGKGGGGEPGGKLMVSLCPAPSCDSRVSPMLTAAPADCHQRRLWLLRQPQEADQHRPRRHPGLRLGLARQG